MVGGAEAVVLGTETAVEGARISVMVARPADSAGMYNGPFWPQAASTATTAPARASRRGRVLTRIWTTRSIWKL